jgi:hypothetical protein
MWPCATIFGKGFCTDEIIDDLIVEKGLSQE